MKIMLALMADIMRKCGTYNSGSSCGFKRMKNLHYPLWILLNTPAQDTLIRIIELLLKAVKKRILN